MPSVIVRWSGRCRDASVRQDLSDRIERLARVLQDLFDQDAVTIRRFDETLRGRIRLDAGLFEGGPPTANLERIDDECFGATALTVFGVEFSVPTLYPGDDRFSFVFTIGDEPALDGLLVHFRAPEQPSVLNLLHFSTEETGSGTRVVFEDPRAQEREEARVRQSDFYVTIPRIHLRYYLEPWTDDLLGWVKRFYIPDLSYSRYEPLSGYDRLRVFDPNDPGQRDRFFTWLTLPISVRREAREPGASEIPDWVLRGIREDVD